MNRTARVPLLTIPTEPESSAEFKERLAILIVSKDAHIYIDASFLMWMTKIGSKSRAELTGWLEQNCIGRVHVPIWSAHEYLKHHVAGTIVTDLDEKASRVASLLGNTYTYFRPFIDEPFGQGAEDPSTVRTSTREALNTLDRLVSLGRKWKRTYNKHAAEVISFINEVTPVDSSVYAHLEDVARIGAGRFMGSVPPGHQDKRKGRSISQSTGAEPPEDSNRYGDLVFWQELLVHAKQAKAQAIIVLTNDRKNDWHMGRSETVDVEPSLLALRKDWKPVPRPHPMLVMEAKLVAGVQQVELLDSPYLAALLREISEDDVQAFADVAIIPDGPQEIREKDRRAGYQEAHVAAATARADAEAREKDYLFPDPASIANSRARLCRALYESRTALDTSSNNLLASWRSNVDTKRPFSETLTSDAIAGFDHCGLARVARELHDRVIQQTAGYEEAVADLVSILDRLPPNTAASVYLGLLASMYLVRESNGSRLPPSSPVAKYLFDRQDADYAINSVYAVAKRLSDNSEAPIYIPSSALPIIPVALDTEENSSKSDQLRSLRVQGIELLTPAQPQASLNLIELFQDEELVDGRAIITKACELFAIPPDKLSAQTCSPKATL